MNRRLQQFLNAENLSQAQFADTLGVARASISHIIAGRNKPGFDFIDNLSQHYPSLNLEWFITGKGKMYKNPAEPVVSQPDSKPATEDGFLFGDEEEVIESVPLVKKTKTLENKRIISKILIFYSDGTFEEYAKQ